MTEHLGFLRAIIGDPDDDTARLIYADWLDERGDPRGEFIRVQCQLARLPQADSRVEGLHARERALLKDHQQEWLGLPHHPLLHWRFERGFVAGLGHAGIFQLARAIVLGDEGVEQRGYLRLYADGEVLVAVSPEPAENVARWNRRGWYSYGYPQSAVRRYSVRWTGKGLRLFFVSRSGQFDRWHSVGTVQVHDQADGPEVLLVVQPLGRERGGWTEAYQLVDVPVSDTADG
jgi:uncharacterized protein (TIGR02996 family)